MTDELRKFLAMILQAYDAGKASASPRIAEPGGTGNMQEADCGPVCKRWFDAEAGRWVCGHPDCRDKEMA